MDLLDRLSPLGLMASFGTPGTPCRRSQQHSLGLRSLGLPLMTILLILKRDPGAEKFALLMRPTPVDYTATREDLLTAAREFFAVVKNGAAKIRINRRIRCGTPRAPRLTSKPQDDGSYVFLPLG